MMASALPNNRPLSPTVIGVLALVQSAFGLLRAFHWFDVGSDLLGQGLLILPMIGAVAFARGTLVFGVSLLYVGFAVAMFISRDWGRALGIIAAVLNLLLVLSVLIQGESLARAGLWVIVPVIILWVLFSPTERDALRRER
jgi:hypothetical protein